MGAVLMLEGKLYFRYNENLIEGKKVMHVQENEKE